MMENSPILAVVVPCYKEEAVLHETHKRLSQLFDRLIQARQISPESYILYVNDGSTDQTWAIIKELHQHTAYACGLNLAGNVGHQNALLAGLNAVKDRCEIAISIDADLQDDIQVIPDMINSYKAGNDIVYGVRKERKTDTFFKRNTALVFYRLMKAMGVKSVYNHADYRLMSQRAVQHLCRFRERNLFFADWFLSSATGRTACITTVKNALPENQSILSGRCSTLPLTASLLFRQTGPYDFWIGCIFILVALCVTGWTLHSYTQHNTVPGWSSLMISVWLVGGVILVSLGIVGEYIGKIYIEVKDRPRYNEEELLMPSGKTE